MISSDDHIFPTKPQLIKEDKKTVLLKTLMPILLLIGFFLMAFRENYVLIAQLLTVLVIHEAGHWLMAKLLGGVNYQLNLLPGFNPSNSDRRKAVSQTKKTWTLLMGPLPGIILGSVLLYMAFNGESEYFWFEIGMMFLFINMVNLMPLDPLDGGKIMETLFFPKSTNAKLYFTLISSFLVIIIGWYLQFWILVGFGFVMGLKVRSIQKSQKIYSELNEIEFDYYKPYHELSNREYWTLRRVFLNHNPKVKQMIPSEMELWENEKLIFEQIKQLLLVKTIIDLKLWQKIVVSLLVIAAITFPLFLIIENWQFIVDYVEQQAF